MSNKQIKTEKIKNMMIVVLLITAILLLSFFWRGFALDSLRSMSLGNDDNRYKPQVSELVVPEYIKVGLGSDGYTLIDLDHKLEHDDEGKTEITVYNKLIDIISSYLRRSDIDTEKIEKSQYNEVMAYSSISSEFAFEVPFKEYIEQNKINIKGNTSLIENMTGFTLSPFSSKNIFISDRQSGEYYRISIDDEDFAKSMATKLNEIITTLESEASSSYYAIKDVAGTDNDTMIPIYMKSYMKSALYSSEISISNRSDVIEMENTFFSDGMDFVRRITENKGSLIYIFGYNEKVLTMHENGGISYKEEFDRTSYKEQNLYESIETAINYVSNHGGWKIISFAGGDAYLKSVSRISESNGKYNGYRLIFGMKIKGTPLEYNEGNIVSVDVCGSQVIAYERDIIIPEDIQNSEQWDAATPLDMLTINYQSMYNTIAENELKKGESADSPIKDITSSEEKFDYVMSRIDLIELCMYRDSMFNGYDIVPKWIVRIKDITFIFDPKSGKLNGYSIAEDN